MAITTNRAIVKLGVVLYFAGLSSALTQEELDAFYGNITLTDHTLRRYANYYVLLSDGMPDYESDGNFGRRDIASQNYEYLVPKNGTYLGDDNLCAPMGVLGFAVNGVPIFNPYTSFCCNAVELETFDSCNGHPTGTNAYHYHQNPVCINDDQNQKFLGIALDGYPIYNQFDENGAVVQEADLDECRGRFTADQQYRYHITDTFPYTLGCFKGDVADIAALRAIRRCGCTQLSTDGGICEPA